MSPAPWNPSPEEEDEELATLDRRSPTLVSLHFLRTALRRRLLVCLLSPLLGLLAAAAFMTEFPPAHAAKASLVLESDAGADPTAAMETNVSLLKTQTLAARTVSQLGLTMTPEDFLGTLTIEPVGSDLLSLTVSAPDDAEAVRRLDALTDVYLKFRGEQLSYQAQILINGYDERIQKLQSDIRAYSEQLDQLTADGRATSDKATELLAQRAASQSRIEALQQSAEDANLRNSAVVNSSRVLDVPTAEPGRATRTLALGLASGLIGGTGLACGTVLFLAITSDRLRRRADVASALGVDVAVSVGRTAPVRRIWTWLPPLQALDRRRRDERRRLAQAIEEELLLPQQRSRLAVAGLDNARELGFAVADAARGLAARGSSITVLDLTARGNRALRNALAAPGVGQTPIVLRSRGVPALARRAGDLLAVGLWDEGEATPAPELTDVTLILADLDPAIGASHLVSWTDRVLVVVTAGRSSVEKARTVSDQVRDSGLDLRFAALLRSERTDHSSGSVRLSEPVPTQPQVEHDAVLPVSRVEAR